MDVCQSTTVGQRCPDTEKASVLLKKKKIGAINIENGFFSLFYVVASTLSVLHFFLTS